MTTTNGKLLPFHPLDDALLTGVTISEISDRIDAMKTQEERYRCFDYISRYKKKYAPPPAPANNRRSSSRLNEKCRMEMVKWSYEVIDLCELKRETVAVAFSYVDRYLCTKEGMIQTCDDRSQYQIVIMTALYIAIKMHEQKVIDTDLLAALSVGTFDEEDFSRMEQRLLQGLKWKMNGPTSLDFIRCYLTLMPPSVDELVSMAVMDYAQFQSELAVFKYRCVAFRPSEIAFAAVVNATYDVDDSNLPLKTKLDFISTVERFSGIKDDPNENSREHKIRTLLSQALAKEFQVVQKRTSTITLGPGGAEAAEEEDDAQQQQQQQQQHQQPAIGELPALPTTTTTATSTEVSPLSPPNIPQATYFPLSQRDLSKEQQQQPDNNETPTTTTTSSVDGDVEDVATTNSHNRPQTTNKSAAPPKGGGGRKIRRSVSMAGGPPGGRRMTPPTADGSAANTKRSTPPTTASSSASSTKQQLLRRGKPKRNPQQSN